MPDRAGKTRLWLAPLDRSSPPRQIPNVEGEKPVFAGDEIFFRRLQGTSAFLYRVREDGTGLQKAMDLPVVGVLGVSADRRSLFLGSPPTGSVIFQLDGDAPVQLPNLAARLEWSGDGRYLFVEHVLGVKKDQTEVVPLPPGHLLPATFPKTIRSPAEIARLPGARVIPSNDVAPGPTAEVYAFTHTTVQRNLYRIPVP